VGNGVLWLVAFTETVLILALIAGPELAAEEIVVVPSTHMDIDFTRPPLQSLDLYDQCLAAFIEAAKTDPRARYNVEHVLAVKHFLDGHPEQRAALRQLLEEGKLEISAAWTNPHFADLSGELMVRQIACAKDFLRRELGYDSRLIKTGELADLTPQLAQVLAKCGVLSFQSWKTDPGGARVSRYTGLDGSNVLLIHTPYTTLSDRRKPSPRAIQLSQKGTMVDGVGLLYYSGSAADDGVPSWTAFADEIERWNREEGATSGVSLRMGLQGEYVDRVLQAERSGRVTIPRRTGHTDHGVCLYLRWGPTKYIDRSYVEERLPIAEKLCAFAELLGVHDYPAQDIDRAWELILSVSTHNWGNTDRKTVVFPAWAREARKITDEITKRTMEKLGRQIAHFEVGTPILVFNPLNWEGTDFVTVEVPRPGSDGSAIVDAQGQKMLCQTIQRSDSTATIEFRAEAVPGLGYKTFYVVDGHSQVRGGDLSADSLDIENRYYRITAMSGRGIVSIYDKVHGRELVPEGGEPFATLMGLIHPLEYPALKPGGTPPFDWEQLRQSPRWQRLLKGMAWTSALLTRRLRVGRIRALRSGAERLHLDIPQRGAMVRVILHSETPRIDLEVSGGEGKVACLFPLNFSDEASCRAQIPYGSMVFWPAAFTDEERPFSKATEGIPGWMQYYNEPWHRFITPNLYPNGGKLSRAGWFEISEGDFSVTYAHQGTYAPLFKSGATFYKLMQLGEGRIHRFSFRSHAGDWRTARSARWGGEMTTPLLAAPVERGEGNLPVEMNLLALEPDHVVVSTFKKSFDGRAYVLRCFETEDRDAMVTLSPNPALKLLQAERAMMTEEPIHPVEERQGYYAFPVKGFEIETIRLTAEP